MSEMVMNMAFMFGLIQLANKFELDQPQNATILQISYGSVQILALTLIGIIYMKINSKNDQTPLVYSEPKPSFQNEDPEIIETTFKDYDLGQLKQLLTQTVMGAAIITFMYVKWGYLRPLLLQSVMGLKALWSAPIIKVHLIGKDASGALKRPWRAPSPFGPKPEEVTPSEQKQAAKKSEKKKISSKKTD